MKYSTGIVLSTAVALLVTGCVKPTEEANTTTTGTDTQTFNDPATDGTFAPTYADDTTGYDTGSSNTVYGTTTIDNGVNTTVDNTVVTTDATATYGATDTYNNTVATNTTTYDNTNATYDNGTTATPTYNNVVTTPSTTYGTAGGAYGNPNATNNDTYGTSTSANTGGYNDTYSATTSTGGYNDSYSSTPTTNTGTYTTNNSYDSSSSSIGSGIHLQVAALKDYYAAQEYKNNLSLDPKYSAYVKKGSINKVIVTGLPSRAAAKALAAKQFPGAFIVAGSPLSSSASSSNSYSSNTSSSSNSSSYSGNGIGVQVGAFSSYSSAKSAAKKAAGSRYTALVKTVDSRGKKLYKAIVTGFSSTSSARSAIASGEFGSAFLVTNIK